MAAARQRLLLGLCGLIGCFGQSEVRNYTDSELAVAAAQARTLISPDAVRLDPAELVARLSARVRSGGGEGGGEGGSNVADTLRVCEERREPRAVAWIGSSLVFDMDISLIYETSPSGRSTRADFIAAVRDALSLALSVHVDQVVIDRVSAGSVVVDWHLVVPLALAESVGLYTVRRMISSGEPVVIDLNGAQYTAPTGAMAGEPTVAEAQLESAPVPEPEPGQRTSSSSSTLSNSVLILVLVGGLLLIVGGLAFAPGVCWTEPEPEKQEVNPAAAPVGDVDPPPAEQPTPTTSRATTPPRRPRSVTPPRPPWMPVPDGSVLRRAASNGQAEEVRLLLGRGAPIEEADPDVGLKAIHMAARNGHLDVVAVLAAQGADVNSRTERQETALISAAIWGQSAMCSQLLSLGADPAATNRFGKTALDKAREEGEAECVAALDPAAGVHVVETMAVVTNAGAAPRAVLRL